MFDHLDDPNPPAYDPAGVDRRIRAVLRRRHRRQLFASAAAAAVVAAGALYAAGHHRRDQQVVTGPTAPALPACAGAPPGAETLTVYDHPSLRVGWLPAGYRQTAGSALPPNNTNPLTYRAVAGGPSIQVTFDVGISSQDPILGIRHTYQMSSVVDVGGQQASVYTSPAFPRRTYIEWNPGYDMAAGVAGDQEDLATLRRVADSITADLGPATVITPTSYLGPVITYQQALAAYQHSNAGQATSGPFTAKLATYAEVRAALGPAMLGGTDLADGTPVWLVYDTRTGTAHPADAQGSYGIINARTGVNTEGGRIRLADLTWVTRVPDHQHVAPCSSHQPATAAPATPTPTAPPLPGTTATIPQLVGMSATAAGKAAAAAGITADIIGETVTGSSPPATVIAETPPAGTVGTAVSLSIAVPAAKPCTATQLRPTYLSGGASGGIDFATIAVRDTSPVWCYLAGPVSIIGLDASGHPVTGRISAPIRHLLVLSPLAPPPPHGQRPPVGTVYAEIGISAVYRGLPTDLCTSGQVIIPAQWQVALPDGATATVANHDTPALGFPGLVTCRGKLGPPNPVQLASG